MFDSCTRLMLLALGGTALCYALMSGMSGCIAAVSANPATAFANWAASGFFFWVVYRIERLARGRRRGG